MSHNGTLKLETDRLVLQRFDLPGEHSFCLCRRRVTNDVYNGEKEKIQLTLAND